MCIRFDKIDGFTRIYDGTRYLTLFGSEKYVPIYDRITYLIKSRKWHHTYFYIFSCYFAKRDVDSYDSLPIEKILTLHHVIIHIKSVLNKNENHYYYKIFRKMLTSITKKITTIFPIV